MRLLKTDYLYLDEFSLTHDYMPTVNKLVHFNQHGNSMRDRYTEHSLPEVVILEESRISDIVGCDMSKTRVIKLWFGEKLSRIRYEIEFERQFMKFISTNKKLHVSV